VSGQLAAKPVGGASATRVSASRLRVNAAPAGCDSTGKLAAA
jgi:hypothetical protein